MAAVIVLKTNLTHFNETNNFLLDAIILYSIVDETGKSIELQLHAGRIEFDTDVLYDRYYSIQFDKEHGEYWVLCTDVDGCSLLIQLIKLIFLSQPVNRSYSVIGFTGYRCDDKKSTDRNHI